MKLTAQTDYALRLLIYLGVRPEGGTIRDIAERYGISKHHLVKVAHRLSKFGYVNTSRGRGGGLKLARDPSEINLGEVISDTEPNLHLVECFDPAKNSCPISGGCQLRGVLVEAMSAFEAVIRRYTLEDVLGNRAKLREELGLTEAAPVMPNGSEEQESCQLI